MKTISYPKVNEWPKLMQRPVVNQSSLYELAETMFKEIQQDGDVAVSKYSQKFDGTLYNFSPIGIDVIDKAESKVLVSLKKSIEEAYHNIYKFHASQQETVKKIETTQGVECWRESRPIDKVGIYIPGGSAPLFSTVLMLGIPAKIAQCKEVVLCTPPDKNGEINPIILYVANLVGIHKVYAVGGIQAIAAMALGTESIPKVDKIFGPGNQYVTAAKQIAQLYGTAIDMPAGPSEVLVIVDDTCDPEFVAADLLSQAEHGPDSQVILLSNNGKVIDDVNQALIKQLEKLSRKDIAEKALQHSRAILFESIDECINFSNSYAPEHLILAIRNTEDKIGEIQSAGSVFLGNYSCESVGDYASGTNHTLPTNGFARSYSGVSLDSFVKKITFQTVTEVGLKNIGPSVELMAEAENLMAHKNAVTIRLNKMNKL
ncbi:MAG: histidinol dehydrogenase [Dysgonamonadaceae bacterium]|nr:histidinol dehydrogenase [Dysgonamonadaceae bacterium]MDD4728692.1 histidinol dehydrogenase [Dysgonamonadaceae bacterium]